MIGAPFSYHDPTNLPEALQLLEKLDDAKPLAGGQSLVPYLVFRMQRHRHLIDLNNIPELSYCSAENNFLRIGAMARQRTLLESKLIAEVCPILQDALHLIGHQATRTRGTIGGSLCNMDPSAELFGVAALHNAALLVRSSRGEREIEVSDWAETFMKPSMARDEMLCGVTWKLWPKGHGHAFQEFSKRHHDYAIVASGALMTHDDDRRIKGVSLMVIGLGIKPTRLTEAEEMLTGQAPTAELFAKAAKTVRQYELFPDEFANQGYPRRFVSAKFRRHLGEVYARRVMVAAWQRAIGQETGGTK
jgi:aerobic carbon-monoxide dehydrogenase medium subunit